MTTRQEPDDAGFVRLFDGTSLDGWSVADGPGSLRVHLFCTEAVRPKRQTAG